jgi:hypothetical protein
MSLIPPDTSYRDVIPTPATPTGPKPFDWKGAGDALGGLMGGVGNLIRGIRGEAPIPMAGMGLGKYLQENDQDSFLTDLISSIIAKTQAESNPILTPSTRDKDNWERPPYPEGTFPRGNI